MLENDIPDTGLVITDVTEPANGMCEATADGFILYTPDDGFFGQDECTCELFPSYFTKYHVRQCLINRSHINLLSTRQRYGMCGGNYRLR